MLRDLTFRFCALTGVSLFWRPGNGKGSKRGDDHQPRDAGEGK